MPPRSKPTTRQARLGAELRKLRERAGMTGREAAERLGVSPMQMSHMEVGRIGVSESRIRALMAQYGCHDDELTDALAAMAKGRQRGWWETFRGLLPDITLDLAEFEHYAHRLRSLQVVHIPGLLQTENYMRSMLGQAMPGLTAEELDRIIEFRLQRQRVLESEGPPTLGVVIHEAALRIRVGSRTIAREQLHALLDAADRPGVRVRVVPFETDGFTGSGFSMHYMEGVVRQLDTAQFDTVHGSVFVDDERELAGYRDVLDRVEKVALSGSETRQFIHRIASDL